MTQTNTVKTIKDLIKDRDHVEFAQGDDRLIRKAMSELSAEGIIFISIGKYEYVKIETATPEQIAKYFGMIASTLRTTYFNRLVMIKGFLTDEQKKELYDFAELIKENL